MGGDVMKKIKRAVIVAILVLSAVLSYSCTKNPTTKTTATSPSGSDTGMTGTLSGGSLESGKTTNPSSGSSEAGATGTTTAATDTSESEATSAENTTPTRRVDSANPDKIYFRDLELTSADGKKFKLSDMAKQYTVIYFWIGEHQICLDQMAILESLIADEGEVVSAVMINSGESAETVAKLAKERGVSLPLFLDEDRSITIDNQVTKVPYLMFLTRDLEVLGTIGGKINKSDFNIIFDKMDEYLKNRN